MATGLSGKSATTNAAGFLVVVVVAIIAIVAIVHQAARMADEHNAFKKQCDLDEGVVVQSSAGEICIPKWIIYGEKK